MVVVVVDDDPSPGSASIERDGDPVPVDPVVAVLDVEEDDSKDGRCSAEDVVGFAVVVVVAVAASELSVRSACRSSRSKRESSAVLSSDRSSSLFSTMLKSDGAVVEISSS